MSFWNCEFCQNVIFWINCVSRQVLCIKRNFTSSANALVIRWREFRITSGRPRRGRGGHSRLFSHCSDPFLGMKILFLSWLVERLRFTAQIRHKYRLQEEWTQKEPILFWFSQCFRFLSRFSQRQTPLYESYLFRGKNRENTLENSSNRRCTNFSRILPFLGWL